MLEARGLACARGERRLFAGVSFVLEAGELLHVGGPNGAGKTTLLRALCGLVLPEAGEVRWRGEPVRRLREAFHRELVYLGHRDGIKDELTPLENLRVAAALAGEPLEEEAALEALEAVGLGACVELPCKVLSQGQRKRVGLARLWHSRAPLWVLDEPFTALDAAAVEQLQGRLARHLEGGGLAVLTTHQEVGITRRAARHLHLSGEPEGAAGPARAA